MTPGEILWRIGCVARDAADRRSHRWRARRRLSRLSLPSSPSADGGFPTVHPELRPESDDAWVALWRTRVVRRAGQLLEEGVPVFDVTTPLDGIDWNRDPKHQVIAPRGFAGDIDYRDFRVVGDAKFVWEPNRHQHLLVLARAWRLSGQPRFAEAVRDQLAGWLEACPFATGMNWRSPLELAVRLINWVWAIDLTRDAGVWNGPIWPRLLQSADLHIWDVARKYSRGSSANNHRIGEAAGVYIGCCYFRELSGLARLREQARQILHEEIVRQTFPDGGTREQAFGYHLFVLQFLTLAAIAGQRCGEPFEPAYLERLRRMYAFLAAMAEGGEAVPMIGDADDGYVVDLDGDPRAWQPWLNVAAAWLDEPQMAFGGPDHAEAAWWLCGRPGLARLETAWQRPPARLTSRALMDSGYYLLQHGTAGQADRISVLFDCGPLGFGTLAAHGHADALSIVLRAFGRDILVDPGTYDYFTYPAWRRYFRSTAAHNTVVVDGCDSSEMRGAFLWGRRAEARLIEWAPTPEGGRVVGEHDGYRVLDPPVVHRRSVVLDGPAGVIEIVDTLISAGRHDYELRFHLAETCRVVRSDGPCLEIDAGPGRVRLLLDPQLSIDTLCGPDEPLGGWVSRGYHRKTPATTILGRCRHDGRLVLRTRIELDPPVQPSAGRAQPAAIGRGDQA